MTEQSWLEEGWFYHNHAWHLLHEIIKLIPPGTRTMLDAGAGTGIAAAIIRAVHPEIVPMLTDITENSKPFWKARGLDGLVVKDEFQPFGDNEFDFIMCSHVLEHSERPELFISELFRVAIKRVVIVVPDGDVHFYDHKRIYDRTVLCDTVSKALQGLKYKYTSFPVYHPHINNLVAVIDK